MTAMFNGIEQGAIIGFPDPFGAPIPAVTRVLSQFPPEQLACFIEVAISLLDLAAPADDDQPDFRPFRDGLPGDPADHEPTGDAEAGAYAEWTSLNRSQRQQGACLVAGCGNEDDEDDDPREEDDGDSAIDDGPCDEPFQDLEEEHPDHHAYGVDQSEPLPVIPDGGRFIMRKHLDRIRRTRCEKVIYTNPYSRVQTVEYRLLDRVGDEIGGGL